MEDHTHSYNYTVEKGPDGQIGLNTPRPYASDTLYLENPDNRTKGHEPLDSLPASWWNFLWQYVCEVQDGFYQDVTGLYNEVCTVITEAIPGVVLDSQRKDQLYQAVKAISEKIATSSAVGGIISSDEGGKVSVDESTGIATANGVGDIADVDPAIRGSTIVDSINNLASSLDDANGKAIPTNHAYETKKYGGGSPSLYGHVRVSDELNTVVDGRADESAEGSSTVLSQYAGVVLQNQVTALQNEGAVPYFNGDFEHREGDPRWLIFDFDTYNEMGGASHNDDPSCCQHLYIKPGTYIRLDVLEGGIRDQRWFSVGIQSGTKGGLSLDLSGVGLGAGKDYYLYLVDANVGKGDIIYTTPDATSLSILVSDKDSDKDDWPNGYDSDNCRKIGQFHTLCVDVGALVTTEYTATGGVDKEQPGVYYSQRDPWGFYNFYMKSTNPNAGSASNSNLYYITSQEHSLYQWKAGAILPESVMCNSWHPKCNGDGMVYIPGYNAFVDIYLKSGTGMNTASKYQGNLSYNRYSMNQRKDFLMVGKRFLSDYEWGVASSGSPCLYHINAWKTTTGGGTTTNNQRMISNIGCEECVGFVWQEICDVCEWSHSGPYTTDGRDYFGREHDSAVYIISGGDYANSQSVSNGAASSKNFIGYYPSDSVELFYPKDASETYQGSRGACMRDDISWPYKWWSD